jgi:hypothetical protein
MESPKSSNRLSAKAARLLGVGLDNRDGHTRVTKGENFLLVGGSESTHERMTETAIKINETLNRRGKQLGDLSKEEFKDILHQVIDP